MDDIIVLDYSNGKVYIYILPRLQMYDIEIEDWLDSMSFDLSNITGWLSRLMMKDRIRTEY